MQIKTQWTNNNSMIMVVVLENNDFSKKSKMKLKDSEISILPIVLWKTTEMPPLDINFVFWKSFKRRTLHKCCFRMEL